MTQDHFDSLMEVLLDRQPFEPFTVELTAGPRFEVDHRHAITFRDGVAFYLKPGGVPVWFDHESVSSVERDIAGNSDHV